jgi:hypothetical protein
VACLLHLVHNQLETRKHRIDRFSIQLREVLILMLVRLKKSSFDLCSYLVIALKPHPDLSSSSTIRDSQTQKGKTRNENTTSLAICVVLVNLLLTDTNRKHLIVSILTNLLNSLINALKMRRHANLPVRVVCSIEVLRLLEPRSMSPLWITDRLR